jgi:putative phosphoesterase
MKFRGPEHSVRLGDSFWGEIVVSEVLYGVVSDTHGSLPNAVFEALDGVHRIFHCGDIGNPQILTDLGTIAPVCAVAGNMDPWTLADFLPEVQIVQEDFGTVVVSHGAQYNHSNRSIAHGLLRNYREHSPRLILFGHSHAPMIHTSEGVLLVNPGAISNPCDGFMPSVAIVSYDKETDRLTARLVEV